MLLQTMIFADDEKKRTFWGDSDLVNKVITVQHCTDDYPMLCAV